jgi:hypothetical protein
MIRNPTRISQDRIAKTMGEVYDAEQIARTTDKSEGGRYDV